MKFEKFSRKYFLGKILLDNRGRKFRFGSAGRISDEEKFVLNRKFHWPKKSKRIASRFDKRKKNSRWENNQKWENDAQNRSNRNESSASHFRLERRLDIDRSNRRTNFDRFRNFSNRFSSVESFDSTSFLLRLVERRAKTQRKVFQLEKTISAQSSPNFFAFPTNFAVFRQENKIHFTFFFDEQIFDLRPTIFIEARTKIFTQIDREKHPK